MKRVTEGLAPLTAWSTPQAFRPNLIKWLAVFCVLDCAGAATLPSSPPPNLDDALNPTFEVVSGPCRIKADKCVYSDQEWLWSQPFLQWGLSFWSWWMPYSNNQHCVIKQNVPFKLDVRSFDVESHGLCSFDSLTVNGVKYCGTEGPQGVTPDDGLLVWQTDHSVTRAGFTICAAY